MLAAPRTGPMMLPDVLPLIAGLGLFMLGMKLLEDALAALAGLPLRRFLRSQADTPVRGMVIGAAATAVLQSSTLVSLLVLAFVGAGIMQLAGAVGVIMGANLGTTLTTWLVASLGFRLDLAAAAMAFIGAGGIGFSLLRRGGARETAGLLLGIGLLLYGLDLMKAGVETWASAFDVAPFADWPLLLMALLGVAVTGTIQSSTAAMMIALGALHGGMVELPSAAAFAAGTGVGTTFTAVLGALGGSADKKRVAAAHLGFNLFKATLALLILHPLLALLARIPGLADPLLRLAAFHTTINLAGIALVLPVAGRLATWLGARFRNDSGHVNHYLHAAGDEVPDAGLEAVRREVRRALGMTIAINREALRIPAPPGGGWPDPEAGPGRNGRRGFDERYRRLKRLEGEIVEYAARLQRHAITPEIGGGLSAQLEAMRMAVSSAKALKDIRGNLVELRLALQAPVDTRLEEFEAGATALYGAIDRLAPDQPEPVLVETVSGLRNAVREAREEALTRLYQQASRDNIGEEALSTLLNVNRALYLSGQSLLRALGQHLLAPETAGVVEDASLD